MREVFAVLELAAASDSTVLLEPLTSERSYGAELWSGAMEWTAAYSGPIIRVDGSYTEDRRSESG
jgi:hypothetical protein